MGSDGYSKYLRAQLENQKFIDDLQPQGVIKSDKSSAVGMEIDPTRGKFTFTNNPGEVTINAAASSGEDSEASTPAPAPASASASASTSAYDHKSP